LTLRGAEVLRGADVVVYDRLSVAALLELAPPTAERINVGKHPGAATVPQDQINDILVEHGRAGSCVVRLKGGDPFVFARGGEEAAALGAAGVDYEVVPGISSALAVPAYAGIPVTQRHSSELFTVITGHEDPDKGGELDWGTIARLGGTIIILMGVGRITKIVSRLIEGGLDPATPAAAVRWGTRPEQHTIRCPLAELPHQALQSPSTIVIGRVAALRFDWFERRPLLGKRVLVTRTRSQASRLSHELRLLGAEPLEVPVIEVVAPADGGAALRRAAVHLADGRYDWLVCTSPNGAERLLASLHDARDLGGVRVAAIGPGTAAVFAAANIQPDLVPERFVAEGLLDAFDTLSSAQGDGQPQRLLLARAEVAREVLPDGLRVRGFEVDVVDAYRTVPVQPDDDTRAVVASAHIVTFTSSSTVTNFVGAFGRDAVPPVVASIGPVTSATAADLGLAVTVEATEHTIDGLLAALTAEVTKAGS
jgi:uroporphyrinogen III methyltransferase/synthase